jgi:hypothetical protein
MHDSLEDVRIELVSVGKELNYNEQTAEGKRDERVNERTVEANTTNRCRAHATKEDELPFVVRRRVSHQRVQLSRCIFDREVIMNNLQRRQLQIQAMLQVRLTFQYNLWAACNLEMLNAPPWRMSLMLLVPVEASSNEMSIMSGRYMHESSTSRTRAVAWICA